MERWSTTLKKSDYAGASRRRGESAGSESPAASRQRTGTIKRRGQVQHAADDVPVENGGTCVGCTVSPVVDATVGAFERPAKGVEPDGRVVVAALAAQAYAHG
jgi:hypothetical protein